MDYNYLYARLNGTTDYYEIENLKLQHSLIENGNINLGCTPSAVVTYDTYVNGPHTADGAVVEIYRAKNVSGSMSYTLIGFFKVQCIEKCTNTGKKSWQGYDAMVYKMSDVYESNLTYPIRTELMLNEIATLTGVYYAGTGAGQAVINEKPEGLSFRTVLGYIAGLNGYQCIIGADSFRRLPTIELIMPNVAWSAAHQQISIDDDCIYMDGLQISDDSDVHIGYIKTYTSDTDYVISGDSTADYGIVSYNPYMYQYVSDLAWTSISAWNLNIRNITVKFFGCWDIKLWDVIPVVSGGVRYEIPVMSITQECDGGLITTINCFYEDEAYEASGAYEAVPNMTISGKTNPTSDTAKYLKTPDGSGYDTLSSGSFIHKRSNNGDTFNIYSNNNDSTFGVNYENGLITIGDDAGLTAGTSPYYHALYHETNSRYRHTLGNGNVIYSTDSTPMDANDTVDYMDEIVDFTYKGGTGKKPRYFNFINYLEYSGWSEVKPFVIDLINGHIWSSGNIIAPGQLIVSEYIPDDTNNEIVSILDDNSFISTPTEFYWLNPIDMKLRKFNSYDTTTRISIWDVVFDFNQGGGTSYTFGAGLSIDTSTNTVTNSGVRNIATGRTNGTLSVNTNGTIADVPVYGLGLMAYKSSLTQSDITAGLGYTPIDSTTKGQANGVAELDANGLVPSSQLPSYVDDILEYSSRSTFPTLGETGKIYVDLSTNIPYRWSGSGYVEVSTSIALGETSSTAYRGDRGKIAYEHAIDTNRVSIATANGLYKIAVTSEGHIAGLIPVTKTDITALGIPAQDTTYTDSDFLPVQNPVIILATGTNTATLFFGSKSEPYAAIWHSQTGGNKTAGWDLAYGGNVYSILHPAKSGTIALVSDLTDLFWDSNAAVIRQTKNGVTTPVVSAATILAELTALIITTALGYTPLSTAGGTLTGRLNLPAGFNNGGIHVDASSGDGIAIWGDNEGGNMRIYTPSTVSDPGYWDIDAYNGNIRIFKYSNSTSGYAFPFVLAKDGITVSKINGRKINTASTNVFNGIPVIDADGVMEVGRYIDFHYNDDVPTTTDNMARISVNDAGQIVVSKSFQVAQDILIGNGYSLRTNATNSGNYSLKITYFTNPILQIIPKVDNTVYLGHNSYRLAEVRAVNMYISSGTAVTSDRRKKNTINDINPDFAENLIMGLKPSSFKYNDGQSDRLHYGFIAQDVEKLINEIGIDSKNFAPLIIEKLKDEIVNKDVNGNEKRELVDNGEVEYSLRYEEFIAPMVSIIQKQQKKINELESRLEVIERMLTNE